MMVEQISVFDLLGMEEAEEERLFKKALERGNIVEGFRERLKENINLDDKSFAEWCKHEFGIGGYSGPGEPKVWFDASGMKVQKDWQDKGKVYPWKVVAMRYKAMYYGGVL